MKKLMAIVAGIALLAGVAYGAAWFFPVLKVSSIEVAGTVYATEEDVVESSGITVGENILRVNPRRAAEGVATLPWVDTATVDRSLPSTVAITVTEKTAVIFARRGDGAHLFDASGKPFIIQEPLIDTVEVIDTKEDNPQVFSSVARLVSGLSDEEKQQIANVSAPTQYEMMINTREGKHIYVGSIENIDAKIAAVATALQRPESFVDVSAAPTITVK